MTIRITLGNVGSGKTAVEVRDMLKPKGNRKTYSNIQTKLKNQITIKPSMIINDEIVDHKKTKSGKIEEVHKYSLNMDYWKKIKDPINVVIDEAHSVINSRRSMSKINIIITDWLALIRRILGSNDSGHGELVLITQLPNRLDTIARDMAVQIKYVICHYMKSCKSCGLTWRETSEMPEKIWTCLSCGSHDLNKFNHCIEVYKFANMKEYYSWEIENEKSWYNHYYITDIETVFPMYNTLQWDNMFSSFY